MIKISIFICMILLPICSFGQTNLDSLWTVWNDHNQPDTRRLNAMHKIAWEGYLYSKPDSAYYFAQLQYDFAKSKGLEKQMADALNTQGVSLLNQGEYDKAIDYHTRSLTIREETGDKSGVSASLNNIGIIYMRQGDYAKTIDYFTRSLTIDDEIGDNQGIAASLNNIGIIYEEQGDYAKAIDYHTRSLTIKEEVKDKRGIASSLHNIGVIYKQQGDYAIALSYYTRSLTIREEIGDKKGIASSLNNIGSIYREQGDSAKTLDYFTRSFAFREEIGDKQGIAASLNNIGLVHKDLDEYAKAIDSFTSSLTIFKEIGSKQGIAISLNNIGNVYKEQGNYHSAIKYNTRAISIAQEVGTVVEISNAAHALYESYKATGKNKQALEMYELYVTIRDSINSEENQREVIRQGYKFEYEKQALADSIAYVEVQKVQEVKLEKSEKRQLALIGGLVLFIVFSVFIFFGYRQKSRSNKLLNSLNDEIKQSYKKLSVQAEHLQISKKKLQMANKELEAFSYSVSHDLRAPLRAINGFTSILMDEYVENLDDEGKRIGDIIQQNAKKMGQLIDDLLNFSRLGRHELTPLNIDMKNMVKAIYDEVTTSDEKKRISFSIADIPEAIGDPTMFQQVWANLISNAVKYSSNRKKAVISVSAQSEDDNIIIYCIKDNGAGFNMDYSDKLFGVFQRLHSENEFPGTGVGLALVQRIIHRHKGKIWAEAEVDKGAAFYFSLPKQAMKL
jgi:signal transduction histidine kinase/Tfp pilus assembly protein PilF